MEFIVTDRVGIEEGVLVRSPYIVISIHDPNKRPAKVRKQPALLEVLVVAFDDAEEVPPTSLPGVVKLMTAKQAGQIRQFVEKHRAKAGTVVVHCEQGMSRSPAVAAALCRALGGDDRTFWREYQPNRHVFRLLCNACAGMERRGEPEQRTD